MALKIREKKKIGLVLSGGGIKAAAFHIGVCLALREKGFRFAGGTKEQVKRNFPEDDPMTIRLYVGSSAGSFVASALSAGYTLEALIEAFEMGSKGKASTGDHSLGHLRPFSYREMFAINSTNILKSLPLGMLRKSILTGGLETVIKDRFTMNGFFTAKGIEKYMREYALSHNEFRQLGVELFIIGTQLNHTRKAIFGNFPNEEKTKTLMYVNYAKISEAVAASVSLPPMFAPFGIQRPDGKEIFFFDGEIRDSLSTHVASDQGADLIIGSYSYQPYHFSSEIGSLHHFGIPVILNQALYQVIQQKIDRHIQYKHDIGAIYSSIEGYFRQNNLPEEHKERILKIIRDRVNYKPEVDYVYIYPRPQNHEMFFADHFSLNPVVLQKIVRSGFKSAIGQLRNFDL
ncbi:MAG: patatin-like phospholipase family protein [Pseudobdellovibrionaceae bacterium]